MSTKEQNATRSSARKIKLPPVSDRPAAEVANWFLFSYAGDQVQVLAGYLDVHELALLIQGKSEQVPTPEIVSRISMTMTGFASLRKQIDAISKLMIANGIPLDELKGIVGPE